MQYNQPYGVSDPNAPYINGNPSTGTMGSIPPAASIEYPQREIVNFITDAGMVPSNSDLHQLSEAIQSGQVIYGDDAGTVNQIVITPSPPVLALKKGMIFVTEILNPNTGATTLKVSSLAPVPVVHASDFTQLAAGELVKGSLQAFGFDGTNFQRVWVQASGGGGSGGPVYLPAPRVFYVNGTTGSDANDGSAAVVGGGHGPFATLQHAADQVPKYNLNGFSITINVADGTYQGFFMQHINGSGQIHMNGDHANPSACIINGVNQSGAVFATGCAVTFDGFRCQSSGSQPPGDPMAALVSVYAGTNVLVDAVDFGPTLGEHMRAQAGGSFTNVNAGSPWRIMGSARAFYFALNLSNFQVNGNGGPAISIPNPVTIQYFIQVSLQCWTQLIYGSLSGAGNVTGQRFEVDGNSTISTGGGGLNYYPGTVAGVAQTSSGGYYT
jgi:hypothetical protein